MLFVPGSDQAKLDKIPSLPARAFILDLEDAVAVSAKAAARQLAAECLRRHGAAHILYVRVNSVGTDLLYDDLHAIVGPGLAGVDVPKVGSAREVQIADWLIGALEKARGLSPGSVDLMATIETVRGLHALREIVFASPRLRRLCFGTGDFSLDIGLDWPSPGGEVSPAIVHAKTAVVLASRQAGLEPPHDGVYPNFRDEEGLRREAELARSVGFFGKHVIHPAQIPAVENVFAPSEAQLARARRLVESFERAEQEGTAAIDFEGQLVDYPVAQRARQLLDTFPSLEPRR